MPPQTSCRAGAVVHLLRANGVKLPVKIAVNNHDDGERMQYGAAGRWRAVVGI